MHIAILTFLGFNELDSLIGFGALNCIKKTEWRVTLCYGALAMNNIEPYPGQTISTTV